MFYYTIKFLRNVLLISRGFIIFYTLIIFARLYIEFSINFFLYLFRGPLVYQFNYCHMLPSPTKSTLLSTLIRNDVFKPQL